MSILERDLGVPSAHYNISYHQTAGSSMFAARLQYDQLLSELTRKILHCKIINNQVSQLQKQLPLFLRTPQKMANDGQTTLEVIRETNRIILQKQQSNEQEYSQFQADKEILNFEYEEEHSNQNQLLQRKRQLEKQLQKLQQENHQSALLLQEINAAHQNARNYIIQLSEQEAFVKTQIQTRREQLTRIDIIRPRLAPEYAQQVYYNELPSLFLCLSQRCRSQSQWKQALQKDVLSLRQKIILIQTKGQQQTILKDSIEEKQIRVDQLKEEYEKIKKQRQMVNKRKNDLEKKYCDQQINNFQEKHGEFCKKLTGLLGRAGGLLKASMPPSQLPNQ